VREETLRVTSRDGHGASPTTTPPETPAWKRYARPGVLVLVTGFSLYLVLPSILAVFGSWRSLEHVTWYWAGLALLCEAASFVSLWQLDRIALQVKSWFTVACTQLSGNAVGTIVPGGGAASTALSVGMLRRAGVDAGRATASLAASSSLQLGAVLLLPVIAVPAILAGVPIDRGLETSAYLGVVVLALLVLAGVLAFAFDRPLADAGRALQWVLNEPSAESGRSRAFLISSYRSATSSAGRSAAAGRPRSSPPRVARRSIS
jgi:putative heme transporter